MNDRPAQRNLFSIPHLLRNEVSLLYAFLSKANLFQQLALTRRIKDPLPMCSPPGTVPSF